MNIEQVAADELSRARRERGMPRNAPTRTKWMWAILALAYLTFFAWYTSFGGPLSEEEIARYISLIENHVPPPPPERVAMLRKFMEEDTGDDFVIVNIIEMYDRPLPIEGVEPSQNGDEVLARYMEYMMPALLARASHPVLYGRAASTAMDLVNAGGMETWSTAAGMRYRSRRDLLEIVTNPAFRGSHVYKVAAMSKTIAFPIDPWFQLGDPRLVLALLLGLLGCAASWHDATRRGAG